MPVGTLPENAKELWEEAYEQALVNSCDSDKECAAKIAWAAVKNAGWEQSEDGSWHRKSNLQEFSLIVKASQDSETGEMRWQASTSDIFEDSYLDNMSLELYSDFLSRIEKEEVAPEQFKSDFWSGGMPYISVSHYPDLNGKAVPGSVSSVYIDGNCLKAKGTFFDNDLGKACFRAIKDNPNLKDDEKVRVSIAFLDYAHKHKSNGFMFLRSDLDVMCPECIKEARNGKTHGKIFLAGQLIHLAMTRVPANKRTNMEVERSMTTRKEDAASIIGEELADELDTQAKMVGKSEALVIKSEDEIEEISESLDEPVEIMEATTSRMFGGATSMLEAKKVVEAQKEQWRVADLWYALQSVMENIFVSSEIEDKSVAVSQAVEEFKDMLADKSATIYNSLVSLSTTVEKSHPLDTAILRLKSEFDIVIESESSEEEKLQQIQESFNELGEAVKSNITKSTPDDAVVSEETSISKAITDALEPIFHQMSLLSAKVDEMSSNKPVQARTVTEPVIPARRSLAPSLIQSKSNAVKSDTPKLRDLINRTT